MVRGIDTTFLAQLEVKESDGHVRAHAYLTRAFLDSGDELGVAPQVLEEFVHVVTNAKRFRNPLTMAEALDKAHFWWRASEVHPVYPNHQSVLQFLEWMRAFRLGRKRIHDTLLAAAYLTNGITEIVTSDRDGFSAFSALVIRDPLSMTS